MSLSLLQGYSSAEEEADDDAGLLRNSSDDEEGDESGRAVRSYSALPDSIRPPGASGLPSAFDAFSEVTRYTSRTAFMFSQFNQLMMNLTEQWRFFRAFSYLFMIYVLK